MKIDPNTVVVITGGSRGIGAEAAYAFAKKGAKTVLAARNVERMNQVASKVKELGSQALVVKTDVSKEEDCHNLAQKTFERWGFADVLVNNAGHGHYAAVEDLSTDLLDQIFRTNLMGSIWCSQAFIPKMKERKKGHIVHVSTVISLRSLPYMTAYCMTKFAMNALDEGLRTELRPYGIHVSLVCPGLTDTEFQMNAGKKGMAPPIRSHGGMSAKKVGNVILKSIERNRRRVALTFSGKLLITLQRISPFLLDEALHIVFSKRMKNLKNTTQKAA